MDAPESSSEFLAEQAVHAALVARVANRDALMWQVPALTAAAQGFLINAALTSDLTSHQESMLSVAGAVLAVLAWGLMQRHWTLVHHDRAVIRKIESEWQARYGLTSVTYDSSPLFPGPVLRPRFDRFIERNRRWLKYASAASVWWRMAMLAVAVGWAWNLVVAVF